MAEELTLNLQCSGEKAGIDFGPLNASFNRDISDNDKDEFTITLNTSGVDAEGTNIPIKSSISTMQLMTVENLDPVNSLTIGHRVSGTYYPIHTIKAQEAFPLPMSLATNNVYGLGIGGAVKAKIEVVPA